MRAYTLNHLSDRDLLRDLATLVAQDRATIAALLAHIAEVDARRLYAPAGHPSMFAYCVQKLRLSEDAAYRRIRAARTARRFPTLFSALADGRLNLTAVILLAPYLTEINHDELLTAAAGKNKPELERLIAEQFPAPDLPTRLQAEAPAEQLAPAPVATCGEPRTSGPVVELPPRVKPLAPQRFALQVTVDQSTHDKLRYAQALLSNQIPSGDVAQVLDRALEALVAQLEKRKFAATDEPRTSRRVATGKRTIPARVKRTVWKRDRGQCTFVSENGHRCQARKFLEFDHIDPVARGGAATATSMRLLCRAHNHFEAEKAFGAGFMKDKCEAARREKELKQKWGARMVTSRSDS